MKYRAVNPEWPEDVKPGQLWMEGTAEPARRHPREVAWVDNEGVVHFHPMSDGHHVQMGTLMSTWQRLEPVE